MLNVDIFNIIETFSRNVIILSIIYQNKTKIPGLFIRSDKLYHLYRSYLYVSFLVELFRV